MCESSFSLIQHQKENQSEFLRNRSRIAYIKLGNLQTLKNKISRWRKSYIAGLFKVILRNIIVGEVNERGCQEQGT